MQLDDACRRSLRNCGIGGSILLLSVWSWDRIPVGRPREVGYLPWGEYGGNPLRRATWAYKYDVVSEAHSDVDNMYRQYTNEFDALTPEQVSICLHITRPNCFGLFRIDVVVLWYRWNGSLMGPGKILVICLIMI